MGKVLAHTGVVLEDLGDGAGGGGDAFLVNETVVDQVEHAQGQLAQRHSLPRLQHLHHLPQQGSIDDRPAELKVVVDRIVVVCRLDRPGVGESLRLLARPVGLDHAGGDDADLLVEWVHREPVHRVSQPVEIAVGGRGGADGEREAQAVLVQLLERSHAQLHHRFAD